MKPVIFHPEAFEELDEAVAFYAKRSLQVAARFEKAVEEAVKVIVEHPKRQAFLRATGKRGLR